MHILQTKKCGYINFIVCNPTVVFCSPCFLKTKDRGI